MTTPPTTIMAMCAIQPHVAFADGRVMPEAIDANVAQTIATAEHAAQEHGARLIVFPQFGLTGYAMVTPETWHAAAITFPGPELDRIGEAARRLNAWIVVQAPERHAAFPGRYFLSCAILGPDGGPVLVHRKGYTLSPRTSPIDVYDRFVDVFGPDAFYPVADTAIGRLGALIGAEPHWPEPCRSLALKGAEIIVNPVAAAPLLDYLQRDGALQVRPVRAFENMVYLGMANIAGGPGTPASVAYDFTGKAIGAAVGDGLVTASVNLAALREWRAQPIANMLAQIQSETTVHPASGKHWPANAWPDQAPQFDEFTQAEAKAWRNLRDSWAR